MKLRVQDRNEMEAVCDSLVLPVYEDSVGIRPYGGIDRAVGKKISEVMRSGEFRGKAEETYLLHAAGTIKARRILLVGLGKKTALNDEVARRAGGRAASCLSRLGLLDVALSTGNFGANGSSTVSFAEGAALSQYVFTAYKKAEDKSLRSLTVLSSDKKLSSRLKSAGSVASAVYFARDLVNTPGRDMTPAALARAARAIKGVTVKVLEQKECERLGMGSYLSVSRGSMEPPKFIIASYNGRKDRSAPVVLVGKSVTFDSGGLSLKPSKSMETMKYDMAGGAAVLGVIRAAAEQKLKVNVICVLPATENLPGQKASKPGDVVRSITGKTIEVLNTDAEGRLALADAIGYSCQKLKPRAVVNIATLTGSCAVALGNEAIALMGNDEAVMKALERSSQETGERVWRMPLYDEYKEYLKSEIADLSNISSKGGGLVTAGYFLKDFAGETPWAHLDIASTGWADSAAGAYTRKGATGIGVRLLLSFLDNFQK